MCPSDANFSLAVLYDNGVPLLGIPLALQNTAVWRRHISVPCMALNSCRHPRCFEFNGASVNSAALAGCAERPAQESGAQQSTDTERQATALFTVACRCSHSCAPNCHWLTTAAGRRVVHAVRRVEAGEELTIDYLGHDKVQPTVDRQVELARGKDFGCNCPRCATEEDASRAVWASPGD
jgi:hypothetical protein